MDARNDSVAQNTKHKIQKMKCEGPITLFSEVPVLLEVPSRITAQKIFVEITC